MMISLAVADLEIFFFGFRGNPLSNLIKFLDRHCLFDLYAGLNWIHTLYMKIHVPSMSATKVETTNKQTQQTKMQPQWLIKFILKTQPHLEKY